MTKLSKEEKTRRKKLKNKYKEEHGLTREKRAYLEADIPITFVGLGAPPVIHKRRKRRRKR